MEALSFEQVAFGPPRIQLWCNTVKRVGYGWRCRDGVAAHSIVLDPGEPFPESEDLPCPVDGCEGRVRCRPPRRRARGGR